MFESENKISIFTENLDLYSADCDCDDCISSCCAGSYIVANGFCVNNMKRTAKIKLFFFLLTCVCVTLGIITGTNIFGPCYTNFVSMDMIWLTNGLSNTFCNEVTISSVGDRQAVFSAYLMESKPVVNSSLLKQWKAESVFFVSFSSNSYHKFRLLKGSILMLQTCSDGYAQVMIIKGDKVYTDFVDNNYMCDDCTEQTFDLSPKHCDAKQHNYFTHIKYQVTSSDNFYIVFRSSEDAWLTLFYNISRTLYDTTTAVSSLQSVMNGRLSLDLKQQYLIVQVETDNYSLDQYEILTDCSPRTWIYLLIFFVVPHVLGICVTIMIYKLCKDSASQMHLSQESNESLYGPVFQGYSNYGSTSILAPPKYADIVRDIQEKPPSYNEVFGSINH